MRPALALLLVVLTGCAVTPAKVREAGPRVEGFATQRDVTGVARCIQRNAENASAYIRATVAPSPINPKVAEVVAQGETGTLAIFEVTPSTGPVKVNGWLSPRYTDKPERVLAAYLSGC